MVCTSCSSTERYSNGKCAPCSRRRSKAYADRNKEAVQKKNREYAAKPESKRKQKNRVLQREYGIGIDDYEVMYDLQEGRCYTCSRTAAESAKGILVVDHCHETGEVRKLLCSYCNLGLGQAGDDVETMSRWIAYVHEHKTDI